MEIGMLSESSLIYLRIFIDLPITLYTSSVVMLSTWYVIFILIGHDIYLVYDRYNTQNIVQELENSPALFPLYYNTCYVYYTMHYTVTDTEIDLLISG